MEENNFLTYCRKKLVQKTRLDCRVPTAQRTNQMAPFSWVALVAHAANALSFTTVVPKVWATGSSSADTICELSLFDVLSSPMLQGFSPGSPVPPPYLKINM
jgi:hypothetical protein